MSNESSGSKYYQGPEGVFYFDGSIVRDKELFDAAIATELSFIPHQVESGPTVPRLATKTGRVLGREAIIDFFKNYSAD
jgi:hypothetical protein